ncbi:SLC13 family permease [Acaryochloris sp. 'Moss Beach']|uniref:SLC13 family permease n=1 Tax=Acaryochloris TaxID=155977 RepID=UPI001BAEDDC7|nr:MULTISPECIES: SLC13 family permease [Acaryochloris]QUY44481.1 SLC13 family permease [Acaryochloris marina S15]UJB69263.1 SLC13 family permease [Acaryochloris sp. 'Moss Beach']
MEPILQTFLVTGLTFLCFVFEWLPPDLTAICVMVVLMLLGLVNTTEGLSGFSNPATITVMAMFILSSGIARTGAIQMASEFLLKWGGKRPAKHMLIMGAVIGPFTAIINNVAIVSVFLPVVEDWSRQRRIPVSKLMIPLSYITILGGMITVLGTSTSVLASGLSSDLGLGSFDIFQFTALSLCTFTAGLIYMATIGHRLLPNRKTSSSLSQGYGLKDYVSEVVVTPQSNLVGQTVRSSLIQRIYDVDILELIHDDNHFPQPLADKTLSAGDILLVRGGREDLLKIRDGQGLEILPDVQFGQKSWQADISAEEGAAEAMVLADSNLVGSTLKDLRFRQRYNCTVLAIRRGQELVRDRLGKVRLRFGDLLLVQGPKQSLVGLQTSKELLVMEQRDVENLRRDKAWIAIAIGLLVVGVAGTKQFSIAVTALAGVMLMVLTGCLKPGELYRAVRWDVVFLLAGLFPLGIAMKKSGATQLIADQLISVGGQLSGYWLLTLFFVLTALLTEILSNNATVILLLPVAVQVAQELGYNPFAFMFVVTFAASNSFMTPIGYQTNTMVYGTGGYRFLDFMRVGGPLSLLMALITPPLIILLYGLEPLS